MKWQECSIQNSLKRGAKYKHAEGYDLFIYSPINHQKKMLSQDVRSFSSDFQIELKIETIA